MFAQSLYHAEHSIDVNYDPTDPSLDSVNYININGEDNSIRLQHPEAEQFLANRIRWQHNRISKKDFIRSSQNKDVTKIYGMDQYNHVLYDMEHYMFVN